MHAQIENPTPLSRVPAAFWWCLVVLHSAYAVLLTQRFAWLDAPNWNFANFRFAEFATVLDLIILPALIYAWFERKKPKRAALGVLMLTGLGLLAMRLWYPQHALGPVMQQMLAWRELLWPVLLTLTLLFELYLVMKIAKHLRDPMKEGAIELILAPIAASLGREHWIVKWISIEQRFWIYTLSRKLPQFDDFVGSHHFSYSKQNGNASNWLGFFIVNLAPTPILHLILHHIDTTLAWVTTILTLLSSAWMWAEYRACQCRPISLEAFGADWRMHLRYGVLSDRTLLLSEIQSARVLNWQDLEHANKAGSRAKKITRYCGMGDANLELKLAQETIWLGVDEPAALRAAILERLSTRETVAVEG